MSGWQVAIGLIGALGVGGWAGSLVDRRHSDREAEKVRDHTTREARAARQWQNRRDVYRDLSTHYERIRAWAIFTEPLSGPGPEPPTFEIDEEWLLLGGQVSITASDAVREKADTVVTMAIEFQQHVEDWKDSKRPPWVTEKGETPRKRMEDARQELLAAIKVAQTTMRDELDS